MWPTLSADESHADDPDALWQWPFKWLLISMPFPFEWTCTLSWSSQLLLRLYNFLTRFLIDLRCWPKRLRKSAKVVDVSSFPFCICCCCCCSFFQRVISTSVSMLILEKYRHNGPFVESSGIFICNFLKRKIELDRWRVNENVIFHQTYGLINILIVIVFATINAVGWQLKHLQITKRRKTIHYKTERKKERKKLIISLMFRITSS